MADETTDKVFPPRERTPVDLLRDEYLAHRLHVDEELKAWRLELGAALARFSPEITPASIGAKVKAGALLSFRYGGVALALGEVAAEAAKLSGLTEIEGPIRVLVKLLGGP